MLLVGFLGRVNKAGEDEVKAPRDEQADNGRSQCQVPMPPGVDVVAEWVAIAEYVCGGQE